MKVFFHEDFQQVYTGDPAAAAGRMEAVLSAIEGRAEIVPATAAGSEDIAAVHSSAHMDYIRRKKLFDIASLAAGATLQAAREGLSRPSFALVRPPGHHASAESAWGFCFFNNVAVALTALHESGEIKTAYVLDIDLHFGDGTQNILGGRDWVTVHNPEASTREAYLKEVEDAMAECRADLICVSAGFDNHVNDWGGLMLTEDYERIGKAVRAAADAAGGGCFAALEGGYNHDVLGENVLSLIRGLEGAA